MARPRKKYPFENIEPGKSRKFSLMRYTRVELEQMLSAIYRRRLEDGTPMYSVVTKKVRDEYVWIDVTCNAPVLENHGESDVTT
jgi:hypothetical protein